MFQNLEYERSLPTPTTRPIIYLQPRWVFRLYFQKQKVHIYVSQGKSEYDALEKDLSHVNIFFGNDHCMGELS